MKTSPKSLLHQFDRIPDSLLDVKAERLYEVIDGPTLIHIEGQKKPALFVSTLLHGNEYSGLTCIQEILKKYAGGRFPRDLSILIGNVEAARYGLRRLSHQPDYNRVWKGNGTPEHATMLDALETMARKGVFASIDIHNNSGMNPSYACVNRLDNEFLYLASLFSRTIVYFTSPAEVQSAAFSHLCPSVTLECGQPGNRPSLDKAIQFIDAGMHMDTLKTHTTINGEIDLFHTVATCRVPEGVSFGFGNTATDIQFVKDIERLNFSELPANTLFGTINTQSKPVSLSTIDEAGQDVDERYFSYGHGEIRTKRSIMPSMLTLDAQIIRQDCLCYLMERLHLEIDGSIKTDQPGPTPDI